MNNNQYIVFARARKPNSKNSPLPFSFNYDQIFGQFVYNEHLVLLSVIRNAVETYCTKNKHGIITDSVKQVTA